MERHAPDPTDRPADLVDVDPSGADPSLRGAPLTVRKAGAWLEAQKPFARRRAIAEWGALGTFFAVAEAYPELKASERFAQLQTDLTDTENKLAFARNYYNGAVEAYNIKVQSFPGLLVARPFAFSPAEFFAADKASALG